MSECFTEEEIYWLKYVGLKESSSTEWNLPIGKKWNLKVVKNEGSVSSYFDTASHGSYFIDSGKDFLEMWDKVEYRCDKGWWPEERFQKPLALWNWLQSIVPFVNSTNVNREICVLKSKEYQMWTNEEREWLKSSGFERKLEYSQMSWKEYLIFNVRYFRGDVLISKMSHGKEDFIYWIEIPIWGSAHATPT